jgi:predicted FMN-binding regulatory protein PaiB
MFMTTSRISELAQQHAADLENDQSEAVTEFGNEENMVHEEEQDGQGSEGGQEVQGSEQEQDAEGDENRDSNSISESEELMAIQMESESIRAAERLSQEHARHDIQNINRGLQFL